MGARRLTAFIKINTTDTTPHALPNPNPAGPVDDAPEAGDGAVAPPETNSALLAIAIIVVGVDGDPEPLSGAIDDCCSDVTTNAMAAGLGE